MSFFVYILTNKPNGVLYTGQTDNLVARIQAHKAGAVPGFTKQYEYKCLVWFEALDTRDQARLSERRIKRWRRSWKIELIEKMNPRWDDLSSTLEPV